MSKYKLNFHFIHPVNAGAFYDISNLFFYAVHKSLPHIINQIDDVLYREIQLTESLTREEEIFLRGLILGYFRQDNVIITKIDNFGDKVE